MTVAVASERIPLTTDADQVIRVGGSRVALETVIDVFNTGASAEEIVRDFPVLRLDDVYAVITYYLRHRAEVDEYVARRRAEADAVRERIEAQQPQAGFRERLLSRRGR
jgi:uncharacterized protein (DUF433 family)